jgi:hypothetical protein
MLVAYFHAVRTVSKISVCVSQTHRSCSECYGETKLQCYTTRTVNLQEHYRPGKFINQQRSQQARQERSVDRVFHCRTHN